MLGHKERSEEEKQKEISIILNQLQPLYDKAVAEGLWFFSPYHQLWFSPRQIKELWKEGRWELRNPTERMVQINNQIGELQKELDGIVSAMERNK